MTILTIAVIAALTIIWAVARFNTFRPLIKRVNIEISHPMDHNGLRILHLSDLHMEKLSISPESLLERIKGEPIDLIALTGDYLDTAPMRARFLEYLEKIQTLNPRYGTYAVFGNHDYCIADHLPALQKEMEKRGCIVLKNEHRSIELGNRKLNIIGIDDYYTRRSDVDQAYQGVEEGINLVLTHDPNIVLDMGYHFDYLLSGHFHGGQIHWPKPYHLKKMGKLPHLNMISGLHYHEQRAFYISDGLGQTGINLRLRCRPEITLHSLGGGVSIDG
ncbi:metallophosphoesterase [Salinithrix halophila]|uniref:Metallophosphoesterase n=1 Tax=Salinithrix halophila TaxID=1485204 RepID=A0ABV8JDG7_9BACL